MIKRSYSELRRLHTFEDRFKYLELKGIVGSSTFGFERYINQRFYTSREWKNVRHQVIARDMGMDLGMEEYDIYDKVIIHHMNPMRPNDIIYQDEDILDPEFLITVSHETHNAIHYGDHSLLIPRTMVVRTPGDTTLW